MDKSELIALAERVEAANGPDCELDALIRKAVYAPASSYIQQSAINGAWVIYDGVEFRSGRPRIWEGRGRGLEFSASLDAAMTLVDAECYWQVGHDGEGRDPSMFAARVFDPLTMKRPCTAVAETAALALTAAALRARADMETD